MTKRHTQGNWCNEKILYLIYCDSNKSKIGGRKKFELSRNLSYSRSRKSKVKLKGKAFLLEEIFHSPNSR